MAELDDMLRLALELAEQAGVTVRARAGTAQVSRKADRTVVTDVDRAVQQEITRSIDNAYPSHAVIGEETLENEAPRPSPREARFCWVIDPIDGTRNFVAGFPCVATSIAVLDRGSPVVAVVVEHHTGTRFWALAGRGAYRQGQRCVIGEPRPEDDWLVGIPSSKDALSLRAVVAWCSTRGLVARSLGSAAYHLSLVAMGALTGTLCVQCKLWDVAAGLLLVQEAGGTLCTPDGEPVASFDLARDRQDDIPVLASAGWASVRLRRLMTS